MEKIVLEMKIEYPYMNKTLEKAIDDLMSDIKDDIVFYCKNGHEGTEIKDLDDIGIRLFWEPSMYPIKQGEIKDV
jgi:hypothetical protein